MFFFSSFSCLVTLPYLIFDYHPMTLVQIGMLLLAGHSAAGFLVFGKVPDAWSWLGYGIILVMAVLMFLYNKRKSEKVILKED